MATETIRNSNKTEACQTGIIVCMTTPQHIYHIHISHLECTKKPRTLFPAYAAFRRRHMHSLQVLHPPIQKFSRFLVAEVRNHLVEEVNQFGTRPPVDCLAWELLLKLFQVKSMCRKTRRKYDANATQFFTKQFLLDILAL